MDEDEDLEGEDDMDEDGMINEDAVRLLQEIMTLSRTHAIELLAQFGGSVESVLAHVLE